MPANLKQTSDDVVRLFVSVDDYYCEKIVVINEDGSSVNSGGSVGSGLTNTELRATPVPVSGPVTDTQMRATPVPVSSTSLPLPTGASTSVSQSTGNASLASLDVKTPSLGQALSATSVPVVLTALQLSAITPPSTAATSVLANVTNATSSVTLLAANASRLGATIHNDDSAASLYMKLGTTASATSFTYKIPPGGYYEVPFRYTGRIDGLATAATGTARITELTA